MLSKILFATDGSEHADRTLAHVKELAQKLESEVVVFHAYHYIPEYVSPADAERILAEAEKAAKSLVDEAASELRAAGVKAETMVDEGPAATEILSAAERLGCDLIALGSRGAGGVTGILMGSVSQRVSTQAKVPVLIVH